MHGKAKIAELAEDLVIGTMGLAISTCVGQHRLELGSFLAVWLTYDFMLIQSMQRHRWSDLAMSVCFVLMLLPIATGVFVGSVGN